METKTPDAGDGISVSTLSVETSRRASSTVTLSPTCFNQRVTVPSVTDSPSAGIVTMVPLPAGETGATCTGGATAATGAATTGAATTGATGAATGASTFCATGAAGAAGAAEPESAMIASSAPTATV